MHIAALRAAALHTTIAAAAARGRASGWSSSAKGSTAARMVVVMGSPHSGQTSRTESPSSRYPQRLHGRAPESVLASAAGRSGEDGPSGVSIGKGTAVAGGGRGSPCLHAPGDRDGEVGSGHGATPVAPTGAWCARVGGQR